MLRHVFKNLQTASEVREASEKVAGLIKAGKIKLDQLSILDIAESTLGVEACAELRRGGGDSCFLTASESVNSVNLSAFTNITGNLIFEATVKAYEAASVIGNALTSAESATLDGGRDIGLGPIDDDVLIVKEGEEYSDTKFGEDYIDIPTSDKRGLRISLTREMVFFDRTGKIIEAARTIGDRMGTNKEKRILDIVLGITNNFVRKGVAQNTYVTTGPRVNSATGVTLVDWTSLDQMHLLFSAMNDDRATPEPIQVMPKILLVPTELSFTAKRIMNATELRSNANAANVTISGNVVDQMTVITSPWIKQRLVAAGTDPAVAAKTWFAGDFQQAFKYRTLFPMVVEAATHDKDSFERDVVAQFRVSERGVPRIVAPWYAAKFVGA